MDKAPPAPPCSACGRTDAKATSKSYDYPPGKDASNSEPVATMYVYVCKCGAAFTLTVKHGGPEKESGLGGEDRS